MTLQRLDAGLWTLNSHLSVLGCKASIRMTVMETDAGLLLHSPVKLREPDVRAVRQLGDVLAIVAPNLFHHMFLRPVADLFPAARVLVPEGLQTKIGPLPRAEVMTADRFPTLPAEVGHFVFERHEYVRETLLFHRPSRTLVTADLLYNYHSEQHSAEKAFFRLIGCYGAPAIPFYHRISIRDRAAVRELTEVVQRWQPLRIIMAHGRIIETPDAAQLFANAWAKWAK